METLNRLNLTDLITASRAHAHTGLPLRMNASKLVCVCVCYARLTYKSRGRPWFTTIGSWV